MCSDAIATAAKLGITDYLVDFRGMTPDLSVTTIYELPRILEKLGDTRESRTAMVVSPESEKKEDFSFFETVSLNQGFQVKLFTDLQEATQWLG